VGNPQGLARLKTLLEKGLSSNAAYRAFNRTCRYGSSFSRMLVGGVSVNMVLLDGMESRA
jgi:hypothetical protein